MNSCLLLEELFALMDEFLNLSLLNFFECFIYDLPIILPFLLHNILPPHLLNLGLGQSDNALDGIVIWAVGRIQDERDVH